MWSSSAPPVTSWYTTFWSQVVPDLGYDAMKTVRASAARLRMLASVCCLVIGSSGKGSSVAPSPSSTSATISAPLSSATALSASASDRLKAAAKHGLRLRSRLLTESCALSPERTPRWLRETSMVVPSSSVTVAVAPAPSRDAGVTACTPNRISSSCASSSSAKADIYVSCRRRRRSRRRSSSDRACVALPKGVRSGTHLRANTHRAPR
mmetsp:Transcript_41335/g.134927  ORF Transcript_41335/g.134927 Transcript_41335/m.134927 type:complete len:209 (+) Transcript_41335:116-742(+)